eukprot:scaffold8977_cov128-Isochrysis_galbana.AAC.7
MNHGSWTRSPSGPSAWTCGGSSYSLAAYGARERASASCASKKKSFLSLRTPRLPSALGLSGACSEAASTS